MSTKIMRVAVLLLPPPQESVSMTDEAAPDEGMDLVPGAQITVWGDDGRVETSLVMTRDELARHVTECRAVYESMQAVVDASKDRWQRYNQALRRREHQEPGP